MRMVSGFRLSNCGIDEYRDWFGTYSVLCTFALESRRFLLRQHNNIIIIIELNCGYHEKQKSYEKNPVSQESDDESHQRIPIRSPANPGEDVPLTCGGEEREQCLLPRLVVQYSQCGPIKVSCGVMSGRIHQQKSTKIGILGVTPVLQDRVWSLSIDIGSCNALWEMANKESEDIGHIGKRVFEKAIKVSYY